ncbi:hypothetical protein BGZ95_003670 [Linnemannia exigua]|uniref:Uncharacterized protein n=1 Tax=Linnemannia exigua TaxID=604196 RepID=A0AAD4D5L9_9FUNG|nr:hypothetical protein BGZ95_003670 [Linnemannia exigua]
MALHRSTHQQDNTTTTPSNANPLKMRRILSLSVVVCLALSLTAAKPIHPTNNNNHAPHRNQQQPQQQPRNILDLLSSSWSSFTPPLKSLHAISGAPNPANSASKLKMLHKRGVNEKINSNGKKLTKESSGGNNNNSNKKKASVAAAAAVAVVDKATAQAKHTYSAYEAIVNSDSQMPVFLNQHHHLKGKGKATKGKATLLAAAAAAAAVGEEGGSRGVKKAGMVTPIDILRQTGTKKPTAAAASATLSAEEEEERERRKKAKEELEGTSPAPKKKTTEEGTTPAKNQQHKSNKNRNTNKTLANQARDGAAVEDGTSTVKTLFDTIFAHDQQPPSRRAAESNTATGATGGMEDSEDFKAIKETINAAAHAAVAAAASSHHLEERDTAGVLKQALENIAHKIEEAATAAIALEIPSLTDHTLDSSSPSSVLGDNEVHKSALPENHQDTIIDDEGAVDLPAVTNNHDNSAPAFAPKQKPGVVIVNDNEYSSDENDGDPYAYTSTYSDNPSTSSEYSDTLDEWRLPDEDDYMAQYVHRAPQNFPGSESILFTGTVLQRTLASSALLLVGFAVLLGLISYKMYARRRNTSPWAFLHYMTFGIFTSLFYDSATISNSTLNAYTTTTTEGQDSSSTSSTATAMKKGAWLRRGSLTTRSSTSTRTNSNNIMSTPAEKEPLLPEPVVASSASSFSFKKSGPFCTTELRRTSTAQHHQMQIDLALQQQQQQQQQLQLHHEQQQRQGQQQQRGDQFHYQHQQAEMEHLQKSFMRRTSI